MKKYLSLISDPSKFSDAGEYSVTPFEAPEGFEWVDGEPPEGSELYKELSLSERLTAIFQSQDIEIQVAFYSFVPQVLTALENNRADIAQLIIESATIPTELEPVRTQLLGVF